MLLGVALLETAQRRRFVPTPVRDPVALTAPNLKCGGCAAAVAGAAHFLPGYVILDVESPYSADAMRSSHATVLSSGAC